MWCGYKRAGGGQPCQRGGIELQVRSLYKISELVFVCCAGDGRSDARLRDQPGQRHGGGRGVVSSGNFFERGDHREAARVQIFSDDAGARFVFGVGLAVIFA